MVTSIRETFTVNYFEKPIVYLKLCDDYDLWPKYNTQYIMEFSARKFVVDNTAWICAEKSSRNKEQMIEQIQTEEKADLHRIDSLFLQ